MAWRSFAQISIVYVLMTRTGCPGIVQPVNWLELSVYMGWWFNFQDRGRTFLFAIGRSGFNSRQGQWRDFFLFATASRLAQESTQPPIQWVPGVLTAGVKRPVRKDDNSPPSSAELKNARSYNPTPQYVFMAWYFVKYRDNFTFTLNNKVN
jgi:hypothetical protein